MNNSTPSIRTETEIQQWIAAKLAERLRTKVESIPLDEPLVGLGIDSMQFLVIVGELEDWLGCKFASNPLIEYPSVKTLSHFLSAQLSAGHTLIDSRAIPNS